MADKQQTVLIVDDNPRMIHILGEALRGSYRVLMALNGERALKRAVLDPRPDIILLDIIMPEMDGMEVCRKLKENPDAKDIPVIFITGKTREYDEEHGLELGAVDYLTKPCSPAILLARVRAHLALRQTRLDLEAANRGLEKRVKRRTRQLEKINENLTREIGERKRAERELRKLRNFLSNIVNSMPSVLVGVNREGRITQWNLEAENQTGITADEAMGRALGDALPGMVDQMENVLRSIERREIMREEKVPGQVDGEMRYSDVTIYPLAANGVEGAVIRVDDVTGRVRMEEMMIQSEKMLSVGGLAAGMAHEINNPLAGILQNIQVMRNRVSSDFQKNRRMAEECGISMDGFAAYIDKRGVMGMIESIIDSSKRAAKIVENMLSFSRKSEARFIPIRLNELLDKTIDIASSEYDLKKTYDFRQIDIIREYEDIPGVPCDAGKIQQVFLNILKNGSQAMGGFERENRAGSRFILRVIRDGDMARVEIEDNGPGMDAETRKRIFEPFFTTKGIGVGTGLGLSVSYFIVTENHKGAMIVDSAPGKGTKFIIRLPFEPE